MRKRYVEVSSNGVDEALQGVTNSPFGGMATAPGLRIPAFVAPDRFLFCLATRVVSAPTPIRGIRQLLTIGATLPRTGGDGSGTPVTSPVEMTVVTPNFQFLDGNVSWHLVIEPAHRRFSAPPNTDAPNFTFAEPQGPSLVYQTFTAAAGTTNPLTGAPLYYQTSLTAYTPPPIWFDWRPLAQDLFTFNDIRFPWNAASVWNSPNIDVDVYGGEQRVSLYATVLQTSAVQRTIPNYPAALANSSLIPPEWQFIITNFNLTPSVPTFYWRVGGALIFEDDLDRSQGAPG